MGLPNTLFFLLPLNGSFFTLSQLCTLENVQSNHKENWTRAYTRGAALGPLVSDEVGSKTWNCKRASLT